MENVCIDQIAIFVDFYSPICHETNTHKSTRGILKEFYSITKKSKPCEGKRKTHDCRCLLVAFFPSFPFNFPFGTSLFHMVICLSAFGVWLDRKWNRLDLHFCSWPSTCVPSFPSTLGVSVARNETEVCDRSDTRYTNTHRWLRPRVCPRRLTFGV